MMGPYGWGYDMMGGGWFGGLLMLLFSVVVIAGVVLLVIWAVRQSTGQTGSHGSQSAPPQTSSDEAVAIARKRLAAGEITKEQYEDLIRVLGG
ncbi:MAG: hypothetical protein RQ731_01600 [Anaerosomatales bacterium]|nr:hypothetical protein [Anaerosomatales bacterium]MDT8433447.1 hypothetical protein [Anaerosomatales bacterium]